MRFYSMTFSSGGISFIHFFFTNCNLIIKKLITQNDKTTLNSKSWNVQHTPEIPIHSSSSPFLPVTVTATTHHHRPNPTARYLHPILTAHIHHHHTVPFRHLNPTAHIHHPQSYDAPPPSQSSHPPFQSYGAPPPHLLRPTLTISRKSNNKII